MNKDAILATIIGFGIGLCITGILLIGPSIVKLLPQIKMPEISWQTPKKETPTPTPDSNEFKVTVDSPLPEAIEDTDSVLVSGTTAKGARVVIAGPVDETAVVAQETGTYAGKISLVEGKNDIVVTAYSDGKQTMTQLVVYFTQESL